MKLQRVIRSIALIEIRDGGSCSSTGSYSLKEVKSSFPQRAASDLQSDSNNEKEERLRLYRSKRQPLLQLSNLKNDFNV